MENPYKAPDARLHKLEHISFPALLFSFEGRINRRDFWRGLVAVCMAVALVELAIDLLPFRSDWLHLVLLLLFHPLFAITAKRYHDQGKSGWLGLIWLAPLIGWVFALIECGFSKGYPTRNKYGPPLFGPLVERG